MHTAILAAAVLCCPHNAPHHVRMRLRAFAKVLRVPLLCSHPHMGRRGAGAVDEWPARPPAHECVPNTQFSNILMEISFPQSDLLFAPTRAHTRAHAIRPHLRFVCVCARARVMLFACNAKPSCRRLLPLAITITAIFYTYLVANC